MKLVYIIFIIIIFQVFFYSIKYPFNLINKDSYVKECTGKLPTIKIEEYIKPEIFNPNNDIAIVTLYTNNIYSYAKYSIINYKNYCVKHNITLYIFNKPLSNSNKIYHGCWQKIPAILYILCNTKHKYVIWMDIDAVFNNFNISFFKYINQYSNKELIVCRDIHDAAYKFNSGVMIMKNNNWIKRIIIDTWNKSVYRGYGGNGDQVMLKKIILSDGKKNNRFDENSGNKKVMLLPEREFNSYPRENTTKNDFIIHFMGHSSNKRIVEINKINTKNNSDL